MPAAVALLIRALIQGATQYGILIVLEKVLSPVIDAAKSAYAKLFNLTDEEAEDTLANDIIDAFATIGIFTVSIRSKIPTIVAEKLKFSSKGYSKRKLTTKAETNTKSKAKVNTATKVPTQAEVSEIATAIAGTRRIDGKTVRTFLDYIFKYLGLTTGIFFAAAQYIDFANWQGPYQGKFQAILTRLGFPPDTPLPKANVVSVDTWKRIYATVEELNPKGISFPFSGRSVAYSRQGLVDLVNEIAANIVQSGGDATYKNVIGIALPLIQLDGTKSTASSPSSTQAKTPTSNVSTPEVKVFTGIVSQGTVGGDLIFTPRPDDLIENASELQQAINNNIAPYLASLLNQVTYEIKVVSSVIVNGIRQYGKTQRIQSGTYKNGTPKYKTVTNKFAVAELYLIRDSNSRTKLTSIVLGPVNATTFQPTSADLIKISDTVSRNVLTSNTDEINTVISNTATTTIPPASPVAAISEPSIGYTFIYDGVAGSVSWNTRTVDILRNEIASGKKTLDEALAELKERHTRDYISGRIGEDAWANQNASIVPYVFQYHIDLVKKMLTTGGTFQAGAKQYENLADESPPNSGNASTESPAPTIGSVANALPPAALSANTLFGFYQALGKPLPSVAERAALYQSLGLGQAAFYTGTAEQNTKLLYKLQNDPL